MRADDPELAVRALGGDGDEPRLTPPSAAS